MPRTKAPDTPRRGPKPKTDGLQPSRDENPGPKITRGGWLASGTAAQRRLVHSERGTPRGERTRRRIIDAARMLFERYGYLDVNVEDIVDEAGVARGSFYTYFPSKLEVFMVLTNEIADLVERSVHYRDTDKDADPVERLCRANERYVETYRQNARIYALGSQLSHIDDRLHQNYLNHRARHIERTVRAILRWQERGLADPAVDPAPTATALVSMSSNLCYGLFVIKDDTYDVERGLAAMDEIWIRTLDLRRRPDRRWSSRGRRA
jgi:AcrR family transcriptional regulator